VEFYGVFFKLIFYHLRWYKGCISREEAKQILFEKDKYETYIHPDGAFVVRDNVRTPGFFSMTVK
jgi:hypothetical protein